MNSDQVVATEHVASNALVRWWIAAQKSLAWRLLHIAKVGSLFEKERAINALAKLSILSGKCMNCNALHYFLFKILKLSLFKNIF